MKIFDTEEMINKIRGVLESPRPVKIELAILYIKRKGDLNYGIYRNERQTNGTL